MSNNVFGLPVTNATVQEVFPGISAANITPIQRAEVALMYMNADDKASNARAHAAWLKSSYGNGTSTLCCIYNATGGNLTFIRSHTWEGTVWFAPYPQVLQNGQWGAFLHVRGRLMGPSKEAIVYRGQNNAAASRDWVLAWNTARRDFQNRVYTEVRSAGSTVNWDAFDRNMNNQGLHHSVTTLGCFSTVSVGAGSSPNFTGIITLEGLRGNVMALANDISAIFPSLDSEHKDDQGVDDQGVDEEATPSAAE